MSVSEKTPQLFFSKLPPETVNQKLVPMNYIDFKGLSRGSNDFKAEEELLIKKRKMLEEKAPGLFDYLTKFTAEEASTEMASPCSNEHDADEIKHTIHIPTPFKSKGHLLEGNLSNIVRADPQKVVCGLLPSIDKDNGTASQLNSFWQEKSLEDKQRQEIMFFNATNSMMLAGVNAQTDNLLVIARQCIESIRTMKGGAEEKQTSHMERMELINGEKKNSSNFDSNPTASILFNHLFSSQIPYKYELVLDCELPVPIFRERNLIIKAKLVDILTQKPVKNRNKVLMQLVLQTWEVPSTTILRNKTGNKAVMGETEVELKNGEVIFDRIQINEVTSKFIHGHVAMLIIPTKPANHGTSLSDHEHADGHIGFDQIKPLMLEKVVVKSKKKKIKKKTE